VEKDVGASAATQPRQCDLVTRKEHVKGGANELVTSATIVAQITNKEETFNRA